MTDSNPSTTELADALRSAAPTLQPEEQRLVVGLYRALTAGRPVPPDSLARDLRMSVESVEGTLRRWPGVYRNDDGDVIGFWGLALSGMPHDIEIGGSVINAWCAIDPLLIAPLLDADETKVRSADPVTGQEVTLTITAEGVADISPQTAMVSMLAPNGEFDHDVVQRFCHYVWFFASKESGTKWTQDHPGTFLLTIDEADQVARGSWPSLVQEALGVNDQT